MVADACHSSSLGRLRQEDHCKVKSSLSYNGEFQATWVTTWTILSQMKTYCKQVWVSQYFCFRFFFWLILKFFQNTD